MTTTTMPAAPVTVDEQPGSGELWDLITAAVAEGCPRPLSVNLDRQAPGGTVRLATLAHWRAWALWMAPARVELVPFEGAHEQLVSVDCHPDLPQPANGDLGTTFRRFELQVFLPYPLPADVAAEVDAIDAAVSEGLAQDDDSPGSGAGHAG